MQGCFNYTFVCQCYLLVFPLWPFFIAYYLLSNPLKAIYEYPAAGLRQLCLVFSLPFCIFNVNRKPIDPAFFDPNSYSNNNKALFALTTKRHIYIASDKNYSNLRNTYALSRARRIKESCGFRVIPLHILVGSSDIYIEKIFTCTPRYLPTSRRWYSGEHSCLPSSWPGFDSRPTHWF